MRKSLKNIHLWLSIPTGILISVICLSGAALVFERDITQALNPHLYRTEKPQEGEFLKPSELVRHIERQIPDPLTLASLQMPGTPDGVCMVSFKETGEKTLSVNPYTGEMNGWTENHPFFQTMRKLHRWLMDPPPQKGEKSVGKIIVGTSTLLMAIILITGLAIWIPRTRKSLKNRLRVSCTKGWRRFWYDSHVSLGFYATLFLLVMALTGLTWSFGWYRNAAYSLFGGQDTSKSHGEKRQKEKDSATTDFKVWDQVYTRLLTHYPEHKTITLSAGEAQVDPYPTSSMRKNDRIQFDPRNGEIKKIIPYSQTPRSQTLKGWFYAFHTGSWGGMTTKILYFLAALIGGTLPLSGYYLWIRRKLYK